MKPVIAYLQWRTKIPGAVLENIASTFVTYQIIGYSIVWTSLNTSTLRMALPSPCKQCWDEETLSGQATLLGGVGKGRERKAYRVKCRKTFVPHCSLIKKCYGTELKSRPVASFWPEISQVRDSLLEEIHTTSLLFERASTPPKSVTTHQVRSCPLCKQAGRNDRHFLIKCTYFPVEDCVFLAKVR